MTFIFKNIYGITLLSDNKDYFLNNNIIKNDV